MGVFRTYSSSIFYTGKLLELNGSVDCANNAMDNFMIGGVNLIVPHMRVEKINVFCRSFHCDKTNRQSSSACHAGAHHNPRPPTSSKLNN